MHAWHAHRATVDRLQRKAHCVRTPLRGIETNAKEANKRLVKWSQVQDILSNILTFCSHGGTRLSKLSVRWLSPTYTLYQSCNAPAHCTHSSRGASTDSAALGRSSVRDGNAHVWVCSISSCVACAAALEGSVELLTVCASIEACGRLFIRRTVLRRIGKAV